MVPHTGDTVYRNNNSFSTKVRIWGMVLIRDCLECIVQMMQVSGHKTQKTFMDHIKLSSDEIDAIANGAKSEVF